MEIADFEEETSPPSSIRRGSPGGMTPDRVPVFQGSESKHFRAEFQGSGFTNSSVVFQGSGSTNSGVPEETGQDASTPPPHHAGRSSPSRKRSPTDPDGAKMTLLAQAEAQVSQTLKKRTVEAMKAKQASLTQAAEDRKAKGKKKHSSDNMKSSQRMQLEGCKAGGSVKVLKRPASKLKAASGSGSLGSEVSPPSQVEDSLVQVSLEETSSSTRPSQGTGSGGDKGRSKVEGRGKGQAKSKAAKKEPCVGCFWGIRPPKEQKALQTFKDVVELFNTGKHWPDGVLFSSEKEAGRSFFSFVRPAPDRPAAIQAWLAKHAKAVNGEGEGEGEKGEKGAKDENEGDTKKGEECAGKEVEKEAKDEKEEGEVVKSEEGVEDETETAREADNVELQEED